LGARILAVCDAYEAITAGRSFQQAVDRTAALEEISRASGSQFDPAVAATFSRMVMQLEATHSEQALGVRRAGFDSAVR
jgi:HD-GYP domain-containing protein (c-di-GMP phosphodiesterase class II)